MAVLLTVSVAAAATGGVLLRHAAMLERAALRMQKLAGSAFELQNFSLEVRTGGSVSGRLAADRRAAVAALAAEFRSVHSHDRRASNRIRAAYVGYLRGSTRAFERAAADRGRTPIAQQQQVDRELGRFESMLGAEIDREASATRVTNPQARLALVIAAVAAALLIGVLIWQFEMQRRSGRIDRDNASRSEELVRLRDDLVSAVSHELRTPLTSILGYLDLIADEPPTNLTDEQNAFLAIIRRNSVRLLQLVSDLLLVAEVEGGGLPHLDIDEVDLGALAADCVEAAKVAADDKGIRLSLDNTSRGRVEGDPVRLAQMMDNLVSNAIKFTPAGGEVVVKAAARDGQALFEVTDSGVGISQADQDQVFDRFFRTRNSSTRAIKGVGLGLAITKAIVDAHRGSIVIESAVGAGTTFRVQLPQSQA